MTEKGDWAKVDIAQIKNTRLRIFILMGLN
jgi:hypothetical protein